MKVKARAAFDRTGCVEAFEFGSNLSAYKLRHRLTGEVLLERSTKRLPHNMRNRDAIHGYLYAIYCLPVTMQAILPPKPPKAKKTT